MTTTPPLAMTSSGAAASMAKVPVIGGAALAKAADTQDETKLKKAAKAFEAVFVRQLIGAMRSSGFGDDLTGSDAVEQFQSMSDARTADTLAEHGGLGISDMMLRQLSHKESAPAPDAAKAGQAYLKGQGE